jgi:hypothetical protein
MDPALVTNFNTAKDKVTSAAQALDAANADLATAGKAVDEAVAADIAAAPSQASPNPAPTGAA